MNQSIAESFMIDLTTRARKYINYFFDHFDRDSLENLVEHIKNSSGILFISGVGKSGAVAKKIAATLSSSGTRALYLPPVDALHGDIGIVSENDTVVLISKSGESLELLQLCPALRNKGAFLVAVVSNEKSRLCQAVDMNIVLPLERELCPFNMVPTTSAIIQLIFGELLAVALMHVKGFTLDEYSINHAAGRIGRRLTVRVHDVMVPRKEMPLVSAQVLLKDALHEFSDKKSGCLVVIDAIGCLLGIFTDGDLRRSLQKFGGDVMNRPLCDLMTHQPRSVPSDLRAYEALEIMEADQKRPITVLPVVEDGKVVGLLRLHDLIQAGI